jgi:hypothetical protein
MLDRESEVRRIILLEDRIWKHRFTEEGNDIYLPGVSYDNFVAAQ